MLQQAVVRIIMPQYEYMFSVYSYGFRPGRNTHQTIQKSLDCINSGYQHIVDIDLEWINYFRFAGIYNKLNELDGWLRNRIRYCIWTSY